MKKNDRAYQKMWLLLAGMIASAVILSLAFTSLLYAVTPQMGAVLVAGGALLSLVAWMSLAVITLERSYEPDRPTRLPAPALQGELKSTVAKS